ncbi:hypothetical protein BP318_02072 [Bordetella pertussis]|nr:hypothetical protein BP318_02072 [Bordetella pertussis]SUV88001.1 Uncharacterised protein [Bordetella pertussis]
MAVRARIIRDDAGEPLVVFEPAGPSDAGIGQGRAAQ